MSKIFAFTVTRSASADRCRLLNDTITKGVSTAGVEFDWHVWASGCDELSLNTLNSAKGMGSLKAVHVHDDNIGQHVAWNEAIDFAKGYEYFLRLDDDCEFLTKRWLKKLVNASIVLNDRMILSPTIRGLQNPPDRSAPVVHAGLTLEFLRTAIGGICRLHPLSLFETKGAYYADVRKPLGSGDATGMGAWCQENTVPMAYLKHVRVRHAKTTKGQEADDAEHFSQHAVFQHIPYIPAWRSEPQSAT